MPNRIDQGREQPTPVADDAHASAPELLARAGADYRHNQTAAQEHQDQGGIGVREGVLPGGTH